MAKKRTRRSSKQQPRQRPRHSSPAKKEMTSSSTVSGQGVILVIQDVLEQACRDRDSAVGPRRRRSSREAEEEAGEEEPDGHNDPLSDALFALANAAEIEYRVDLPRRHHQQVPQSPPMPVPGSSSPHPQGRSDASKRSRNTAPERHDHDHCTDTCDDGVDGAAIPPDERLTEFRVRIRQDMSACGRHTGGIVWETCYVLLEYLQHAPQLRQRAPSPATTTPPTIGRCLEVGAGCGLLGQVLWYRGQCQSMVLTETDLVLDNLRANVRRNQRPPHLDSDSHPSSDRTTSGGLHCCRLDWTELAEVQQQAPEQAQGLLEEPFDTIVGTDVVFAPHLVDPLLRTMRTLSHHRTVAYLCVQVRCAASHALLLERASIHGWTVVDRTSELPTIPSCAWGAELECHLLQLISTGTHAQST